MTIKVSGILGGPAGKAASPTTSGEAAVNGKESEPPGPAPDSRFFSAPAGPPSRLAGGPPILAPDARFYPGEALGPLIEEMRRGIASFEPMPILQVQGHEDFRYCKDLFSRLVQAWGPVFDPLGRAIALHPDDCDHVCIAEDRHDKSRKRAENEERTREEWEPERAAHMLWIFQALSRPSMIAQNHKEYRNLAYLLGFPKGVIHSCKRRYYVSVRPQGPKRGSLVTAFPCKIDYWKAALRGTPGEKHVLWRNPDCSERW